ncbi:hypothetical protein U1769_14370 [Sphingomonas sp. ZT3P38]|uniref:hypothetical protein n=1 Tax=Parasphingomonas zepuensis TaxID=3096161 RepID=UPI002FC6A7DD
MAKYAVKRAALLAKSETAPQLVRASESQPECDDIDGNADRNPRRGAHFAQERIRPQGQRFEANGGYDPQ